MAQILTHRLRQLEVLAIQLNALGAAVVVDLESIGKSYRLSAAQARIFVRSADIAERDRVEGIRAGVRGLEPHLHMPAADNSCVHHRELAVKNRLWKALAPRARAAQRPGGCQAQLIAAE